MENQTTKAGRSPQKIEVEEFPLIQSVYFLCSKSLGCIGDRCADGSDCR